MKSLVRLFIIPRSFLFILLSLFLVKTAFTQSINCERTTTFGITDICLPQIEGLNECYEYPTVKKLADATEIAANVVLGYYLTDSDYALRDSLENYGIDNYYKVYATTALQDQEVTSAAMNEIDEMMRSNFISNNWDDVKDEIDDLGLGVDIGQPLMIGQNTFRENTISYNMLVRYQQGVENELTLAMTINCLIVSKRLIWMAHYLLYEDEDTITDLEKNTKHFLDKFYEGNSK